MSKTPVVMYYRDMGSILGAVMLLVLSILWKMIESNGWYQPGWVWLLPIWTTNIILKLPRLALQVEMSWNHSLVLSVGQYFVTQLSQLLGCRLNMNVLFVDTGGLSTQFCKGILWLYWNASWEILLCLFQLYQLLVQYLEFFITT